MLCDTPSRLNVLYASSVGEWYCRTSCVDAVISVPLLIGFHSIDMETGLVRDICLPKQVT